MRIPTDIFHDFQKAEYERIAEAHFKTIEAISSFFRYYLVIMSLAPTAAVLLLSRERASESVIPIQLSSNAEALLGLALIVVASVGFCLMLYVTNLRMDGILYARTVNAIRKYFYDNSTLHLAAKQQLRVLPQTRHLPPFFEPSYFYPVVFTFIFLDSAYFFAGFSLWSHGHTQEYLPVWELPVGMVLFVLLHLRSYSTYSRNRERFYLETSAIGIDIDGVLNKHREHFCEILKSNTGRAVSPGKIRRLPVSENPHLRVTNAEEIGVFHVPSYWTEMPVIDDASRVLRKLRNELNLQIHMFSHRPWPVPSDTTVDLSVWSSELRKLRQKTKMFAGIRTLKQSFQALRSSSLKMIFQSVRTEGEIQLRSCRDRWLALWRTIYVRLPWIHFIDRITHVWLYRHTLQYDRLIIEKGHTNLANPNARFVNRFNIARRHRLRFFVEDDLEKAEKLAHICDVVFLMNHPYNQTHTRKRSASNIQRVDGWNDIFTLVKSLS